MDGETWGRLAYLALLLVAVGGWVLVEYRGRMGQALRAAAAWALIFIGVAAGYGLWTDMQNRISPVQIVQDGEVVLPRADDGHYYATLTINGAPVTFLADTGATTMVLTQDDARSLGIDPDSLTYLGQAQTANGIVRTASVTLPEVQFGPFRDTDVRAHVTDGDLFGSLLGMDYLDRFDVRIEGRQMILTRGGR
jgi:aspartyl protease family protein